MRLEDFKDCTKSESVVDDLVITCDETVDIPEATSINFNNEINYWFLSVVILQIACLLLLLVITVKYCMNCGLTIPCLLSC